MQGARVHCEGVHTHGLPSSRSVCAQPLQRVGKKTEGAPGKVTPASCACLRRSVRPVRQFAGSSQGRCLTPSDSFAATRSRSTYSIHPCADSAVEATGSLGQSHSYLMSRDTLCLVRKPAQRAGSGQAMFKKAVHRAIGSMYN